jgi:phosphocarrier protein
MQFVDLANQFRSKVTVVKGGEEPYSADGKSVMQMIILAATQGTPLRIDADGDDADDAVQKLAKLFEDKFGEE